MHFVGLYCMLFYLGTLSLTADCAVQRRISGRLWMVNSEWCSLLWGGPTIQVLASRNFSKPRKHFFKIADDLNEIQAGQLSSPAHKPETYRLSSGKVGTLMQI